MIVDDEQEIAGLVALYLENDGFSVFKYYTAADALKCRYLERPAFSYFYCRWM